MFKPEDLVKGTKRGSHYGSTNEFMLKAEVLDVYDGGRKMEIIMIEHEYDQQAVSEIFDVHCADFDLISSTPIGTKIQSIGNTVPSPNNDYELLVILGEL